LDPAPCPRAAHAADSLLAVLVPDDDTRLAQIAALIKTEVSAW
jgi:perosamine synthetase